MRAFAVTCFLLCFVASALAETRGVPYTAEQLEKLSTLVFRGTVTKIETVEKYDKTFPTSARITRVLKGRLDDKEVSFKHKHPGKCVIFEKEFNIPKVGEKGTFYVQNEGGSLVLVGYIRNAEPEDSGRVADDFAWAKITQEDPMVKMVAQDLGEGQAKVGGKYTFAIRKVEEWDLVMLTPSHRAPHEIVRKYLYKPHNLLPAKGRHLLFVLNELYEGSSEWQHFSDQYALDLVSIADVREPQNFGVKLITSISDIEGIDINTLDPDLRRAVVPPARFRDSTGRGCYVAYFYSRLAGRILRLRLVFDRKRDRPDDYSIATMSQYVGHYYMMR